MKTKDAVLAAWRRNEITLVEAVRKLVELGFGYEQSWAIVEAA